MCDYEKNLLINLRKQMQQSVKNDSYFIDLLPSAQKEIRDNTKLFATVLHYKITEPKSFVPNEVARVCYENLLTYESLLYYPSSVLPTTSDADTQMVF